MTPPLDNLIIAQKLSGQYLFAFGGPNDCRATPGETPRAGIRQGVGGEGETLSLPAPAQNSNLLTVTAPLISSTKPLPSSQAGKGETCPAVMSNNWTCNREQGLTRVVGFSKLRNLLQPKHPYFEGKWAEVKYWTRYLDEKSGCDLVYPKVKTFHRENPYRRYQLNRQCSARSAKSIFGLIESYRLPGFRVTGIETTMPAVTSVFLASKGKRGRDMAWSMNTRFWQDLVDHGLVGAGHARRSNLHTWKTDCPLEPHFHFHELLPNYERVGGAPVAVDMPGCDCPGCGGTLWAQVGLASWQCVTCYPVEDKPVFQKREWSRQRGGTMVPWLDRELSLVKALWLNIQINYARKYCIQGAWDCQTKLMKFQRRCGLKGLVRLVSFLGHFNKGLVDVYVTFVKLNYDLGRAKFVNKLSYNGRHPVEDFVVYSNKNPDCSMPPEFIQHYDNKARLHGWWRDIKKIVILSKSKEKEKLSPYNAEPMKYLGRYYTSELLFDEDICGDKKLMAVDVIRGSPVERLLGAEDLEWLKSVAFITFDVEPCQLAGLD
ncbi:hypothetical protein ES708_13126 [subsurface metagenome]